MSQSLPVIIVALPFASAVLLAIVRSWRAGIWINVASSSLLFGLACLLPRATLDAHLAMLTGLVVMTSSWFGWRDIPAALTGRRLNRRTVRYHHVAAQGFTGGILLAVLSHDPMLTWLGAVIATAMAAGMTGTIRTSAAQRAAARLLLLCGAGLMLALFGTLLLSIDPTPSYLPALCLLVGYGSLAGLPPLHAWLADAIVESSEQGATLISALLVNVPLIAILRLRPGEADAVIVPLGAAMLVVAACCVLAQRDTRRRLAFGSMAQTGIVVFAFGLGDRGATIAGLLLMTVQTLIRAALAQGSRQSDTAAAQWTRAASMLAFAGLPVLAMLLLAGATVSYSPALLVPLGGGALLATASLIAGLSVPADAARAVTRSDVMELAPVWLQLALAVAIIVAMPGPMAAWFGAMAEVGR